MQRSISYNKLRSATAGATALVSMISTFIGRMPMHYFHLLLIGLTAANLLNEIREMRNKKNDAAARKSSKAVIVGSSVFILFLLPLFWHTHLHDWQISSCAVAASTVTFYLVSGRQREA